MVIIIIIIIIVIIIIIIIIIITITKLSNLIGHFNRTVRVMPK